MSTLATPLADHALHPVRVYIEPAIDGRNRLTTFFRIFLALPHLLLVGGPVASLSIVGWTAQDGLRYEWGAGGVFGALAAITALISWFAILFTGRHPEGLREIAAMYLRWRLRAVAYVALLRDEYPPFGDLPYPTSLALSPAPTERDRLSVALRVLLAIPHLIALWALGIVWFITTIIAWFAILFTGRFPPGLHQFGCGVLRWNLRVEAYLLLVHDTYPPFSLAE